MSETLYSQLQPGDHGLQSARLDALFAQLHGGLPLWVVLGIWPEFNKWQPAQPPELRRIITDRNVTVLFSSRGIDRLRGADRFIVVEMPTHDVCPARDEIEAVVAYRAVRSGMPWLRWSIHEGRYW